MKKILSSQWGNLKYNFASQVNIYASFKDKKILYLAIDFQCIWLAIVIQADKTKKLRYRIASQTIIHISFKDKKFNT